MRGTYGLDLTKQITPGFGLGLEYLVAHNTTGGGNAFDSQNLSLLGKFNLSNLFCGYNGKPRLFEVEAVAGVGWGHDFYPTREGEDGNYLTTKYGLNFNFNVGEAKAWTIGIKPAIVYNMNNEGHRIQPSYNVNRSAMEFLVGVTYHFKNSNNGKNYMTLQRAYDQAEVDGLNAKINDLRTQNGEKQTLPAQKDEEIRNLQQQLNDCRNQETRNTNANGNEEHCIARTNRNLPSGQERSRRFTAAQRRTCSHLPAQPQGCHRYY